MFALRGVKKRYGATVVLDVDLELWRARTSVLLGPSGCGKSTLLRLLVGLVPADAGQVLFDGQPLEGTLRAARRRIGYVIQEGGLFPHLTATENVALPARGRSAAEVQARVDELAELVRLPSSILERYPLELS